MTLLHQAAQKAVEAHYKELGDAWIAFDGSPGTAKRVNFALGMLGFAIDALVAQMSALQQQTEPVAWLVTGGRAYNDRAYIAKDRAELEAVDRRDGSKAVPLYTAPALQHQEEPPPECKTEEEKRAFAFGWWKAMEANRARCAGAYAFGVQEVPREPVARPSMSMYASAADYSAAMDGWIATTRQCPACKGKFGVDGQACDLCNATGRVPSTTRQQEAGSAPEGFRLLPVEATDAMMYADWDVTMSDAHSNGGVSAAAWRAMVEAAPQVTYGNGHSGVGWYMHDTDYPEEGAVFLGAAAPSTSNEQNGDA